MGWSADVKALAKLGIKIENITAYRAGKSQYVGRVQAEIQWWENGAPKRVIETADNLTQAKDYVFARRLRREQEAKGVAPVGDGTKAQEEERRKTMCSACWNNEHERCTKGECKCRNIKHGRMKPVGDSEYEGLSKDKLELIAKNFIRILRSGSKLMSYEEAKTRLGEVNEALAKFKSSVGDLGYSPVSYANHEGLLVNGYRHARNEIKGGTERSVYIGKDPKDVIVVHASGRTTMPNGAWKRKTKLIEKYKGYGITEEKGGEVGLYKDGKKLSRNYPSVAAAKVAIDNGSVIAFVGDAVPLEKNQPFRMGAILGVVKNCPAHDTYTNRDITIPAGERVRLFGMSAQGIEVSYGGHTCRVPFDVANECIPKPEVKPVGDAELTANASDVLPIGYGPFLCRSCKAGKHQCMKNYTDEGGIVGPCECDRKECVAVQMGQRKANDASEPKVGDLININGALRRIERIEGDKLIVSVKQYDKDGRVMRANDTTKGKKPSYKELARELVSYMGGAKADIDWQSPTYDWAQATGVNPEMLYQEVSKIVDVAPVGDAKAGSPEYIADLQKKFDNAKLYGDVTGMAKYLTLIRIWRADNKRAAEFAKAKDSVVGGFNDNEGVFYHTQMLRTLNKRLKEVETGPGSLKADKIALAKELRAAIDAHQDALEAWRTSRRYPSKGEYEDEAAALSAAANKRSRAFDAAHYDPEANAWKVDTDNKSAKLIKQEGKTMTSAEIARKYGFSLSFVKEVLGGDNTRPGAKAKDEDLRAVCAYCGATNGEHKDSDNKCPDGEGGWLRSKFVNKATEPTIYKKDFIVSENDPRMLKHVRGKDASPDDPHKFQPKQKKPKTCVRCGGPESAPGHSKLAPVPVNDAFAPNPALTSLAEKAGNLWRSAPNTREGLDAAKMKVSELCKGAGVTPKALADYITKMATANGRRVNVNWLKNMS